MVSENARDTQFAHSAKSVVEELVDVNGVWIDTSNDYWREEWEEIIAHYAYDLVKHTIQISSETLTPVSKKHLEATETMLPMIPDLTKWPEVKSDE